MHAHALKPPVAAGRKPAATQARALPSPLRAKLRVGARHDAAERQADRIADQVVRRAQAPSPAAKQAVRRALAAPPPAARAAALPAPATEAPREQQLPDRLEHQLLDLMQGGHPLPGPVRRELGLQLGMDLSAVRIHTGIDAARLADAVHAHAFAVGDHIVFGAGQFAPGAAAGRHLLAHELAHVAQYRGQAPGETQATLRGDWKEDLLDAGIAKVEELGNWTAAQVESQGMRLVERISPEFAATLRAIRAEGLLHWLGRQVARAWEGFIGGLKALVPFEGPRQLIDVFAGLVERAAAIVAALASGNCEAVLPAIAELKRFVVETAGVAWDKLAEFLRPVGALFSRLWHSLGAPALEWLREFGGAVWDWIKHLGRQLWQWTAPLREEVAQVWDWFRHLLFGDEQASESTGSEGGLVGWLTRQAAAAWEWVKETTRPVWQPVADLAAKVAELIPPAFVRQWAESARQLSAGLEGAAAAMNEGDGVADNRDTLAALLPSVETIIAAVRRLITGAGEWLAARIEVLGGAVQQMIGRLRASALLSWLGSGFDWLTGLLDTVARWARGQVQGLFALLLRGFDAMTPFLRTVLDVVRRVIAIYADILQLPLLAGQALWRRLCECIRAPVEKFVTEQILSRIPVFGQFFEDEALWPRVRDTALRILRRLFADGDLPGAAWLFFQSVLAILKVPAELVVRILAKAAGAMGDILRNPLGFLGNLLRAMGAGFMGFFSRIGAHLLHGFTGWLFGTLGQAGIKPPQDLSLGGILDFVMQVLDLTVDRIFARLAEKIGPETTERLRRMLDQASGVWSFVATLVQEGPAGLWRQLTEKLSNLWDTVFSTVTGYINEAIIGWATRWILSLLDVTGITPIINALIAVYKAVESFFEYLRELLEIVSQVLDGIAGIANGAIEDGAGYVERALGSALPIAIGFLANQAGLGRLSKRLHEMFAGLREKVAGAIDWMIERAIRLGKALLDLARRGAAAVGQGIARLREWWRARKAFRAPDGEEHHVYLEGSGASAKLMVASTHPTPYADFLEGVTVAASQVADKEAAITIARKLDAAIAAAAADNPNAGRQGAAGKPTSVDHAAIIDGLLQQLATVTARFMPFGKSDTTPTVYGTLVHGFGSSASVLRLAPVHPDGKPPTIQDNEFWEKVNKRKKGNGSFYVRGHLLNENLGGPGNKWENLTPLTQAANGEHKRDFENAVKRTVNGSEGEYRRPAKNQLAKLRSVNFVVTARYGQPARSSEIRDLRDEGTSVANDIADIIEAENRIPVALDCRATMLDPQTGQPGATLAPYQVQNTIDTEPGHYVTRAVPKTPVYLDCGDRKTLMGLDGVDDKLARAIIDKGPFHTRQQFQTVLGVSDSVWRKIDATPGKDVRLYRRK